MGDLEVDLSLIFIKMTMIYSLLNNCPACIGLVSSCFVVFVTCWCIGPDSPRLFAPREGKCRHNLWAQVLFHSG
jgi:hypothetical protein